MKPGDETTQCVYRTHENDLFQSKQVVVGSMKT